MTTITTITPELLDQLLADYEKPEDLTGHDRLFKQLKKALIERALGAELTEGYKKGNPAGRGKGNSRRTCLSVFPISKGILVRAFARFGQSIPNNRRCAWFTAERSTASSRFAR